MKPTLWIVVAVLAISASAGAAWYLAAPEPDMELQAGDRFAYNVTRGESTRTYVADVIGMHRFADADGILQSALAIAWSHDELRVLAHYGGGNVERVVAGWEGEGEDRNINPYVPYDETYSFQYRSEKIQFPDLPSCIFAEGELDCHFAPFGQNLGREGNVTVAPHDKLPLAATFAWPDGTAELVGFERNGNVAIPDETATIRIGTEAPGIPSANLNFDFPLHEAVDIAMNRPEFVYFQEWMGAHPDHYLVFADYWAYSTDAGYSAGTWDHRWAMEWTDGLSAYQVFVSRNDAHADDTQIPLISSGQPLYIHQRGGQEVRLPPLAEVPPMPVWSDMVEAAESRLMEEVRGLPVRSLQWHLDCSSECADPQWTFRFESHVDDRSINPTVNTLVIPDVDRAQVDFTYHGSELQGARAFIDQESATSSIGEPASVPAPPADDGPDTVAMAVPAAGVGAFGLALLAKILLPLFSRVRPDHLAEHPIRRRILDAVDADAGIHLGALERRLDIPTSTMKHHVRKLIEGERIQVRRLGRYQCLFPAGPLRAEAVAEAGVVRSDGARQILDALRIHPGLGVRDLADATGLNASTVSYHARRLEQAGSVIAKREGRVKRLRLA